MREYQQTSEMIRKKFQHSQRMVAVGQMAAGVTHEFNNLLTVILVNTKLLKMKPCSDQLLDTHLDPILIAAERAANLSQKLLSFCRQHEDQRRPVRLSDIVSNVQPLLARLVSEEIEFRVVTKGEGGILADAAQIEQVIMNLVANARDAMPLGGIITITTDEVKLDGGFACWHGITPGKYARLSIADTGAGISGEDSLKIFEPFFTTKKVGKGTGLGLSIAHRIVQQHKGHIDVRSEKGMGTEMSVFLPLTATTAPDLPKKQECPPPPGSETVLLAEDEPMLRALSKTVLEEFGYQVVASEDGQDAVEKFKAHGDAIKLLILDLIMPGMNGKMVYEEIKRVRPDIKVLFISGYSEGFLSSKDIESAGINLLMKPFARDSFLRRVREVLDRPHVTAPEHR